MKHVSSYLDVIMQDKQKEAELKDLIEKAMSYLETAHPEHYKCILCKLHCLTFGPHFDMEMAEWAVSKMENTDGTIGEHWSVEETNVMAGKYAITELADWYFALNMLRSDLYKVIGNNDKMYCEIARSLYFADPDMKEGKLFLQWSALQD